ncbi:MAG TPA: RHS repeat-associated core domain-containing protein [Verrucomicrobiae bacterium]|nr:RHS repeat-associated core domain-containing protein [Verrucomicrobiae bacterium]
MTQAEGPLTDTASLTWHDANGNLYGPVADSFTSQVQNTLRGAHLTLAPVTAGPLPVGSEHTLIATLTDRNNAVVAGQTVHFAVTGPNATTGNAITDGSGVARFTYQGNNAGTDQAQATATKNATTVQSNTASASWIAPIQPVSIGTVHGNFYTNTGVAHFTATPASTPVFGQDFPTIDFNPPAGTVLNNISAVGPSTRPFTDLTTDINGNYTGSIVAEGNGHQAGVADLTHFDAVFGGNFVVTQASDVTFNVFSDAGFILGVGGGATRVNGAFENPPASGTTPFQAFPVVGAYNLDSGPAAHPVTIHFPAPGTYPFEIDYFECCDSQLSLTLTTVSFIGDASPLSVYVGYADGLRPGGSVFPFPWKGAPGVTFIGDNGTYDAGALRFDNSSDAPIVLDSAIVEIAGVRHDIWGRNLTVPAHGTLITTQTVQYNFDTSDDRGATCTPIGTIPHVIVTIAGVTTTYNDTSQILNTKDVDLAVCPGGPNESHAWERIGGGGTPVNHALPPAAALTIDPNTASATVGLGQAFTITAMDAAGHPVANLPVNVQVFGVNARTLTATTDSAGIAIVNYMGTASGKDQVQARAFVTGLLAISDVATVTWSNPIAPGGGTPSPFPPPSIGSITPADGATVTEPVAITATITPPTGATITDWKVTYQRVGTAGSTEIASGTGDPPATLGTFDPTVAPNGTYLIAVTANASNGGFQTSTTTLVVEGNLKLGRYVTTYKDLSIGVGGLPMQVLRTYDSFDKSVGDFGVGWRVELSNFRVSTGRPLGLGGWTQYNVQCFFGLCLTGFKTAIPHIATVTWPDGHQEAFDFTPGGGTNIFWTGTASFTPRARATSTLAVDGSSDISYRGDGNLYAGAFGSGTLFDPQRFRLTARDGTVYVLDRTSGLVSATDRNGDTLTVSSSGIVSSLGPSITFTRDALGRITRIDGPASTELTYAYSTAGDLASFTDPAGQTFGFTYDGQHNLLTTDDPAGHPFRTITYDTSGRLESITDAAGNTTGLDFDVDARQEIVTDAAGLLTMISTFNDQGDVIKLDETADGHTLTATYEYDALGHQIKETDFLHNVTSATWTDEGDVLTFTDEAHRTTTYTYDAFGAPLTITGPDHVVAATLEYDPEGHLVRQEVGDGQEFTYQYDPAGRLSSAIDPTGRSASFTYTPAGRVASVEGPDHRIRSYTYDALGRVSSVIDPGAKTTSFVYDDLGHLLSVTDPLGRVQSYSYDAFGRVTTETDGLHGVSTYVYDDAGRLVGATDRNHETTQYGYDANSRLLSRTTPDNVTEYAYDGFGRLVEATDADSRVAFTYDDLGRVLSQAAGGPGLPGPATTLAFAYDPSGRPTSVAGPGGTTTYTYDAAGRLTTLASSWAGTFGLAYDRRDRLTGLTRPNGVDDALTWNDANQLVSRIASSSSGVVASSQYTYTASGQRATLTDPAGQHDYGYDPQGRLIAAAHPGATPDEAFTYNDAGDRTSWNGSPAATVHDDAADRLLSDGRYDYAYDGEGHRISRIERSTGAATTYDWTTDGLLTAVHHPGGTSTTFRYDPLGRRTEVNDAGVIRRFVWDHDNVALEYDGSNALVASYAVSPLIGNPFAVRRGGQVFDYLLDGLGSTVGLADASGHLVDSISYGAYGTPTAGTGDEAYAYTGHQFDEATGLYYARARYYDPETGSFLSEDPLPAINRYAYSADDPINLGDPSGCQAAAEYGLLQRAKEAIRQAAIQEIESAICQELVQLAVLGLGGGPNGLGAAAENFVSDALGETHNNGSITAPSGRTRIPDFIVEDGFVEVKNTARLSGTSQILDYVAIAEEKNAGPLVLVTRNSTKLSSTLKNLIDAGRIRLVNCLPG